MEDKNSVWRYISAQEKKNNNNKTLFPIVVDGEVSLSGYTIHETNVYKYRIFKRCIHSVLFRVMWTWGGGGGYGRARMTTRSLWDFVYIVE